MPEPLRISKHGLVVDGEGGSSSTVAILVGKRKGRSARIALSTEATLPAFRGQHHRPRATRAVELVAGRPTAEAFNSCRTRAATPLGHQALKLLCVDVLTRAVFQAVLLDFSGRWRSASPSP